MPDRIIFLGDSITESGDWNTLFPDLVIENYGYSGDKTYQVIERVDKLYNKKADQLFLWIGINDLGDNRNLSDIVTDYRKLVYLILINDVASYVHLVSVLPVKESKWSKPGLQTEKILQLNEKIEIIAKENDLNYINIHSHFADRNGELKEELTSDGLHLSEQGYEVYKKQINTYL